MTKNTLIMVDLQKDFCRGGSLAVPDANAIISIANKLQAVFDLIVATQDWHPSDHTSFAVNHPGAAVGDLIAVEGIPQVLWPVHCVQHSEGAKFHEQLDISRVEKIIHKGIDKVIDSYSAFFDNAHKRVTGLHDYLQSKGIMKVYILGLATDYCVKYSALDAIKLGYKVTVIIDACRGVEREKGDIEQAFEEMRKEGVNFMISSALL